MPIQSVDPATGSVLRSYSETAPDEAEKKLKNLVQGFEKWRRVPFAEKSRLMLSMASRLESRKNALADLMAGEMGKPLAQGTAEIEKCAAVCVYYAENAESFLSPIEIRTEAAKSYAAFEPLGVLLAVMPWNFPFWQVFRASVPALMAGNTVALKHASNVPGCAEAIQALWGEAGFPTDIFENFYLEPARVAPLIAHRAVKAVTLTGSTGAGKSVAAAAGAALKKTVLELGGSDPYLIFEDADLESAAKSCAQSRLINAGQSCIAAKRFLAVESIYESFAEKFLHYMNQKVGDPRASGVTVGPLARHDLRDSVHRQVTQSISQGAVLLAGGKIPSGPGAFYPPTVLGEVLPDMTAFREEIFGPVAALIRAKDARDAVRLANQSAFGLGAALFTRDISAAEKIAREELKAGSVFVNAPVRSDPRLPFGGVEESGYGRELSSFGIREFVNIKTVYLQ